MILINKDAPSNNIYCTVTENTTVENPVYTLVLYDMQTQKTITISLGTNYTAYISRYDMFTIDSSVYNLMDDGDYNYSIYQTTDTTLQPVEIGMATLFSRPQVEYVALEGDAITDEYVIFNG